MLVCFREKVACPLFPLAVTVSMVRFEERGRFRPVTGEVTGLCIWVLGLAVFFFSLGLFDDVVGQASGDFLVGAELHREGGPALGHGL